MNYNNIHEDQQLTQLFNSNQYPKYIYTNATYSHANLILNKMNIENKIKKIYSRDTIPLMKPDINSAEAVERDFLKGNNQISQIIFLDDLLENLQTGKNKSWTTVWISPKFKEKNKYRFVDYAFPDIKYAMNYFNKYK
jgi:FMN phosphatase YigB (HAD superfamily)